jgi:hypothetical protein
LSTAIFLVVRATVKREMANSRQEVYLSSNFKLSLKVVWERYGEQGEI